MFSSLRAKNTKKHQLSPSLNRPIPDQIHQVITTANTTTHPNTISLNAGNLIVGNNNNNNNNNNNINGETNENTFNIINDNSSTLRRRAPLSSSLHHIFNKRQSYQNNDRTTRIENITNTATNTNTTTATPIQYELEISYHESRISEDQILLNLEQLPDIKEGDLCQLKTIPIPNNNNNKNNDFINRKKKIYLIAKNFNQEIKRRSKGSLISIKSGQLQNLLDLPLKSKTILKKIQSVDSLIPQQQEIQQNKKQYHADLIEINIKDCLLNRGDMWDISSRLINSCVFMNEKLTFWNNIIRGTIKGIYKNGEKILSSYINENTKIIFRSESAKLIFLIQITQEMWDFDENGEQIFQKMINSFFPKIFKKWKNIDTHHNLTIAFAISIDRSSDTSFRNLKPGERLSNSIDYYRIVVDQVNIIHWVGIMDTLRKEFMNLTKDLLTIKTENNNRIINGQFAPVIKSNFLEMINFATTTLTNPFKQLDLRHTTTHLMIITPGTGLYDVDYDLLRLTGKKLLSLEMTMDLICLQRAPLHVVPLFRYLDYQGDLHYAIPNWFSIFFWNDNGNIEQWHPRCKIHDLQMMGLTENEICEEQEINPLQFFNKINTKSISQFMEQYDNEVFDYSNLEFKTTVFVANDMNIEKSIATSNDKNINDQTDTNIPLNNPDNIIQSKAIVWKGSKFASPVLEDVQKPQVLAAMYPTTATSDETKNSLNLDQVESNQPNGSLALDSLKGISKKHSLRDFTNRMLNKILPAKDIDGNSIRNSKSARSELNRNRRGDVLEREVDNNTNIIPMQSMPIIKKNLSMFGNQPNGKHNANSISPNAHSYQDTLNSSKISSLQDKKNYYNILDSTKSKLELKQTLNKKNYFNVPNETWLEIRNPSIPVEIENTDLFLPVRWKDVWPRLVPKRYSKWRSFTTPAELPTTISEFVSKHNFETNLFLGNHSVSLSIDQDLYNQTAKDLLRNMIYMRLVMGFQICFGDQVEKVEITHSNRRDGNNLSSCNIYIPDNKSADRFIIYMMIDLEIHRIECDNMNGIIDVKRYLRKDDLNPFDQVPTYRPLVKTRYQNDYRETMMDPIHVTRESLNWNQIDQALAGYTDYAQDKTWTGFRSKFVVLPAEIPTNTFTMTVNGRNETLTPEEIRVEGLRRLIASVTKARLKTEKEKVAEQTRKEEIQPEVMFYTGSLFNFVNDQQELLEKDVIDLKDSIFVKDDSKLNKDIDLRKLAYELQCGSNKLKLTNRNWHWKQHKNCFVGSEMVTWLILRFSDIESREEALEYGQHLMKSGLFVHVLNKHGFLDGHYFYQLSPKYVMESRTSSNAPTEELPSTIARSVTRKSTGSISETATTKLSLVMSNANSYSSATERHSGGLNDSETHEDSDVAKPNIILSNSLIIDVDPMKKSYKQEICTVHYDRVHNPEHCFHIRLEWLTTTPKLVDDLVGNWSRLCERYGLKLIEIPWEELCSIPTTNPFHSFVEIHLAINPWEDPEFYDNELYSKSKFYYHIYLLKSSGFLLDNRASKFLQDRDISFNIIYSWGKPQFKYAQYIHISGAYMAEIRENGDLFLAPNNVYISRVNPANIIGRINPSPKFTIDAQKIMLDFKDTCSSYEKLRVIYLEAKEKWNSDKIVDEY
ncbi:GTPase-activating protein IML1 NDAI_0J03020 [Naumovozyma dairenensis CBS 421]|uniref:Vacuolar membrane-associated protein IML1 n=1 Tax=Naumovozyma dairenensis (strain ATCC 10597 / BCRC 20456 / CBS 421 / NBRC 0211 / NRRL Y-12639) TaxID=1071378 RepID=G0WHB6_NAUDC|nr:hypothetical protein NDAI_0J03020 [Naumovozyma dairenensis CBS 421]CCD27194.1 hypothetical protein NDAI_0J03020 [Naumovozyma dairenensis CBS 421]